MKAVLVIDMPNEAKIEEYRITYVVYHLQGCGKGVQGVGASLRPLPEKMIPEMVMGNKFAEGCVQGWNDCIDEITGETE